MNSTADRAVTTYLKHLDADLADLPPARRREIVDEITEHIAAARAELPAENEAETRSLLERLGDPADIAAEARQRFDVPLARPGWQETVALVFLLVGGFIFIAGWFVGLVLLWTSSVWTVRDKLVGTFIVPGGLPVPLVHLPAEVGAPAPGDLSERGAEGPRSGLAAPETARGLDPTLSAIVDPSASLLEDVSRVGRRERRAGRRPRPWTARRAPCRSRPWRRPRSEW